MPGKYWEHFCEKFGHSVVTVGVGFACQYCKKSKDNFAESQRPVDRPDKWSRNRLREFILQTLRENGVLSPVGGMLPDRSGRGAEPVAESKVWDGTTWGTQPLTSRELADWFISWSIGVLGLELKEESKNLIRQWFNSISFKRSEPDHPPRHHHNNIREYKSGTFFRYFCGECGETLSEGGL